MSDGTAPVSKVTQNERLALLASGALLLLGCIYAILYCSSAQDISGHSIGTDDAFISYRYARNLVRGDGLVFNPGEHVEGYTNLLYVLLMAIPFALDWNVLWFSVSINCVFTFAAWFLLVRHLRARFGVREAVLGGFLFALSPSIWLWTSSGLETPLVFVLQLSIWLLVDGLEQHPSRRSLACLGAALGVLTLTRADGFVSAGLASAYLLVKGRRREALVAGGAVVVVFGGLLAWRLHYYHDVLPNTYYAKVTSTLARRLKSSVKELGGITARQGLAVYLLAIAYCALSEARRALKAPARALGDLRFGLAFSVCWLGYWLYVGGDNFEDRFLIILIPIGIYLLLGSILAESTERMRGFFVASLVLVQLCVVVRSDQFGKSLKPKYDKWITMGRYLGEHWNHAVLATPGAGKVPFYSDFKTIDMLGLCDAHIGHLKVRNFIPGHSKSDVDYVLSLKPDLMFVTIVDDDLDVSPDLSADKYRSAGFRVRLLLNTTPQSRGSRDVLDVLGRPEQDIALLAREGWDGVVLERAPRAESATTN
ncbi:MAG TPA: glycosyltransferase family 39 protein [Polyangiaceae bacterium]|nr:glycosyltransferase family 39 protein [Polyangiaceae bacterium]